MIKKFLLYKKGLTLEKKLTFVLINFYLKLFSSKKFCKNCRQDSFSKCRNLCHLKFNILNASALRVNKILNVRFLDFSFFELIDGLKNFELKTKNWSRANAA